MNQQAVNVKKLEKSNGWEQEWQNLLENEIGGSLIAPLAFDVAKGFRFLDHSFDRVSELVCLHVCDMLSRQIDRFFTITYPFADGATRMNLSFDSDKFHSALAEATEKSLVGHG